METIEDIITNPDVIYSVINVIKDNFPVLLEKYCPNNQNKNPNSHYMSGSCGEFAYLLDDIFKDYASFYVNTTHGHVVMKIGDYFWDVNGMHTWESLYPGYNETPKEFVEFDLMPFTRTDDTDKILKPYLLALAKERLNSILLSHGFSSLELEEKKEKSR